MSDVTVEVLTRPVHVAMDGGGAPNVTVQPAREVQVTVSRGSISISGGASYVHTQSSPSATWTINHNLGFRPAIELYTTGGVEFIGEILHTSLNQAIVYLASALAGTARCN